MSLTDVIGLSVRSCSQNFDTNSNGEITAIFSTSGFKLDPRNRLEETSLSASIQLLTSELRKFSLHGTVRAVLLTLQPVLSTNRFFLLADLTRSRR
jgi:hypothetical protein